tara:strand:- start:3464 stop:3811 length:348 start_codon:yes stop_codon:yes gene_type:complete
MKFNDYLVELRKRKYQNGAKLAKILGVEHRFWRKIERGINPPPKRSLLDYFCRIVNVMEYEKNQLYALARRWEPHQDSNTPKHILWTKETPSSWTEAMLKENTPDYPNKYWSKNK